MKSNQIIKFIHLCEYLYQSSYYLRLHGEHLFGVAFISLLIKGAKLKGQNYFTKHFFYSHEGGYSQNFLRQILKIFVTLGLNILRFYRPKVFLQSKY